MTADTRGTPTLAQRVKNAKLMLGGFHDTAISGILPGAPRVADEICTLLDDLLAARSASPEPRENLAARMLRDAKQLDPEAQRVLSANLWDLYVDANPAASPEHPSPRPSEYCHDCGRVVFSPKDPTT